MSRSKFLFNILNSNKNQIKIKLYFHNNHIKKSISKNHKMSVDQVPVLHVRGSNYEIGFSIGRTFSNLIRDFVDGYGDLKEVLIPAYESEDGRQIYETCLKTCNTRFPQYVKELEGISQGSGIPFFKLFLLHIDTLIIQNDEAKAKAASDDSGSKGCTNIICNHDNLILGHTEDALASMTNNFFIVSAQVIGDGGEIIEDFSSIVYPGYLPGYTMGYNSYGILHAINTIRPSRTFTEKSPVMFITRALLSARSSEDCLKIVKDSGCGISDGFSFDLVSLQENQSSDSAPVVWNVEVGPSQNGGEKESEISILEVKPGTSFVHCNKYLRLKTPHNSGFSSGHRHAAIASGPPPNDLTSLKNALSDTSNKEFPVFRSPSKTEPLVATICVGIFDVEKMTWSIYTKPPKSSQPVAVLPLKFNP